MSEPSMYAERADLYDLIYSWKDYRREATRIRALLAAEGVADGARLLEAAVGTGSHLVFLKDHYDANGFDLSQPMLEVARRKLPGIPLWRADMASFTVTAPYDALVCLFSSIGYLRDAASLAGCAASFARALVPGGALVVEPWFAPEAWTVGKPHVVHYASEEIALARMCVSERKGELAVMDLHWLVGRRGGTVEHFVEHHELWLCPHDRLVGAFRDAGFDVRYDPDGLQPGRGLVIGRKR